MRTTITLALSLPISLSLSFVALGCGGSSTNHLADSGTDAPHTDAAKHDAPADGTPDAAPTGKVSVAVDNNGTPGSGDTVYF
jgi:hypothetical protein